MTHDELITVARAHTVDTAKPGDDLALVLELREESHRNLPRFGADVGWEPRSPRFARRNHHFQQVGSPPRCHQPGWSRRHTRWDHGTWNCLVRPLVRRSK